MNELQQKTEELNAKRTTMAGLFEAAGPERKMNDEALAEVQRLNKEIDADATVVATLRETARIETENKSALDDALRVRRPVAFAGGESDRPDPQAEKKSIGDMFVDSEAFKGYNSTSQRGPVAFVGAEVKTLVSEAAGFAPQAIRTGMVVDSAQQQPKIVDVIPATSTTMTSVVFMQETTFTNNAAETAEAGTYPEAALAWTEVSSPVRKIAVILPVTDEQLQDVDGLRDRINNRLLLMLRQRLDAQLIAGNGSAPNLDGLLHFSGTQAQARGADENIDAIHKAITLLQTVDFTEPNAILMNPLNWQAIRLLRTADGLYIFGSPADAGVARLWGLPIVQSTYVTANSAIVADFQGYTEIAYKQGIEFEVTNSHDVFFAAGKLAIRAQFRCAFVIHRPTAVAKITGLTQ